MPASKSQQKAVAKYMKNNYDEIKVRVPKGHKAEIEAHAQGENESLNGFINRAIDETIKRDGEREQQEGNND
jgi:predicted HicB family RNase H-like nuclease